MLNLLLMMIMFILILFIMLFINLIISKKMFKNKEKMLPFECGFESMSNNRLPFSLQFYLISIIFLIFDVEIALIIPMVKFMSLNFNYLIFNSCIIMMILIIGLLIEWKEGALFWY